MLIRIFYSIMHEPFYFVFCSMQDEIVNRKRKIHLCCVRPKICIFIVICIVDEILFCEETKKFKLFSQYLLILIESNNKNNISISILPS